MSAWGKVEESLATMARRGFGSPYLEAALAAARAEDAGRLKQAEREAFRAGFVASQKGFLVGGDVAPAWESLAYESWQQSRQPVGSDENTN